MLSISHSRKPHSRISRSLFLFLFLSLSLSFSFSFSFSLSLFPSRHRNAGVASMGLSCEWLTAKHRCPAEQRVLDEMMDPHHAVRSFFLQSSFLCCCLSIAAYHQLSVRRNLRAFRPRFWCFYLCTAAYCYYESESDP